METDLITTVREAYAVLYDPGPTRDDVLKALDLSARLREVARELTEQVEAGAIAWVQAHGEIIDGDVRYYVGANKSVKCRDVKGTLGAVLEVTGGDLDAVIECLSSGAFKPAKTKALLGKRADEFFETTETMDLKTGAAGKPRLQKHDPRFIR